MSSLEQLHFEHFGKTNVRYFQAPARINIIGEHVDYLGGLVLPAAIDFYTKISISENKESEYRIYATQFEETLKIPKITFQKEKAWANYILGVISEFEKLGHKVPFFDMVVSGNIPTGSGLSSSASLEVVVAYALNTLFGFGLDLKELALLAKRAENLFVGVNCGIMDQFAIAFGKQNHCILLNTETLEYSYHLFDLGKFDFFLIKSSVKHALNDGSYNAIRESCESALRKIQKDSPEIQFLYSLSEDFAKIYISLSDTERQRCEHVVGERKRTKQILDYFQSNQISSAGELLTETHWSLSKLFQVSCKETDFIVEYAMEQRSLGARMIGGGFGGCILVLDSIQNLEGWYPEFEKKYQRKFGLNPQLLKFKICNGVSEIEN